MGSHKSPPSFTACSRHPFNCRRRREGVLPNHRRTQKVGRAVPSAPPQSRENGPVALVTHNSGAVGAARPTPKAFRQHALTPSPTVFVHVLNPPVPFR